MRLSASSASQRVWASGRKSASTSAWDTVSTWASIVSGCSSAILARVCEASWRMRRLGPESSSHRRSTSVTSPAPKRLSGAAFLSAI